MVTLLDGKEVGEGGLHIDYSLWEVCGCCECCTAVWWLAGRNLWVMGSASQCIEKRKKSPMHLILTSGAGVLYLWPAHTLTVTATNQAWFGGRENNDLWVFSIIILHLHLLFCPFFFLILRQYSHRGLKFFNPPLYILETSRWHLISQDQTKYYNPYIYHCTIWELLNNELTPLSIFWMMMLIKRIQGWDFSSFCSLLWQCVCVRERVWQRVWVCCLHIKCKLFIFNKRESDGLSNLDGFAQFHSDW